MCLLDNVTEVRIHTNEKEQWLPLRKRISFSGAAVPDHKVLIHQRIPDAETFV